MQVLREIPFDLDSPSLMKRAHVAQNCADAVEFERFVQAARSVGRPKAGYREAFIDLKGEQTVTIEGITFTSRILRKNLEHAERVFAFLVTCGRELDQVAVDGDDWLAAFWWDLIKGELLSVAIRHLAEHLDRKHLLPQTSSMHPGSGDAAVWPIEQQRQLFALLGEIPEQIGVELTDTYLMIPNKTVSGIRFPTENSFRSCQVCQRSACPNRAAALDEALWATVWHE
ncbi:MAG: vitamin B12 dependent methionine synthase [Candidatus Anammoximicrobium sp.]|nr:vitamin B12 dependent methionine synthase [Candidatus Anammoximicrobium sp.]